MIDYQKLTDLEVAILMYAMEEDDIDRDEEISAERYTEFQNIYEHLNKEYVMRGLHISMFSIVSDDEEE